MNPNKTVLLIPSSYYLSDTIFTKIVSGSDCNYVYLDPAESAYTAVNIGHS